MLSDTDRVTAGMLGVMETPAHERRQIEEYLHSQSGDDFEIERVEKITSEYVFGRQYDVWDAHTSDGRWWVITNPMKLYSQAQIKSMDIALSFHIGLMSRVMARDTVRAGHQDAWVAEVARRLDVASANLDQATDVEDFQAVGMRLRETLLTLAAKIAGLGYQTEAGATELQKGNFKAWASVCAESVAPGSSAQYLRALLKSLSEKTWNYVAWLTHARAAGRPDAQIALSAASQTIEAFIVAVNRQRLGTPHRCPVCASYRLWAGHAGDGSWVKTCETCGWGGTRRTLCTGSSPRSGRPTRSGGGRRPASSRRGMCGAEGSRDLPDAGSGTRDARTGQQPDNREGQPGGLGEPLRLLHPRGRQLGRRAPDRLYRLYPRSRFRR